MSGHNKETNQEHEANLDHKSCGSGVIYLTGWAFNGKENSCEIKIFLQSRTNGDLIPLPITMQCRADVNKHFDLPPSYIAGFSSQIPLEHFNITKLPAGNYEVITHAISEDNRSIYEKKLGRIDIHWPEKIKSINKDHRKNLTNSTKKLKFFKQLWKGTLGSMESVQNTFFPEKITAQNIIDAKKINDMDQQTLNLLQESTTLKISQLLSSASKNSGLISIFDHDFGGGANVFSHRVINRAFKHNNVVLRVWHNPTKSSLSGAVYHNNQKTEFTIGNINSLFDLLSHYPPFCLQINNLYSWPYIDSVLDNVVRLRVFNIINRLEFFAHDHISICPSLFLLNEKNQYCGVPKDDRECNKCLTENTGDFKVFYKKEDVKPWRNSWSSVLTNSDYIRFFSQSTFNEYVKAYPDLKESAHVVIKGHTVPLIKGKVNPINTKKKTTNIGIFGFLNQHKGSKVVLELADSIEKKKLPIHIHVFGSLNGISNVERSSLNVHGPYEQEDLASLWNEYEIDFALVPSICPETFSLTTAELLSIGATVITFDLGAQAELITNHPLGIKIPLPHQTPIIDSVLNVIKDIKP